MPDRKPTELEEQLTAKELEKIAYEIRYEKAKAGVAEIELIRAKDTEKDRKAMHRHTRRLNFSGPVYGGAVDDAIDQLEHWEYRDPGEPIILTFNSPGGDVIDGLALYDTILRLRRKGHKVTTRATGMAASMGGILLQAGDTRIMDAHAHMLIHEITAGARGKTSEMEDSLKFTKKLQDKLLTILAERSTLSKAQIATRWKKTDWWLDAEEALAFGLVDAVE